MVPKTIENHIQDCALKHLGVKDMGKLRDKYDAELYYKKLRQDILAEYAFEKFLNLGEFDWHLRSNKNYNRKTYLFNNKNIKLCAFTVGTYPKLNPQFVENVVFIYIKPDLKCYISGIGTKEILSPLLVSPKNYNPMEPDMREVRSFKTLIPYNELNELKQIIM